jgi:hypothetical protein
VTEDQETGREVVDAEFVEQGPTGVLAQITRGEIDIQIATAKRYPRSVTSFQREAASLAMLNIDMAEECMYSLPRGGKTIIGPSARFAEILAYSWGNCRAGARVVDVGEMFLTAQGNFYDVERNSGIQYEVQRRITDKNGDRYKDDMIVVASNAACSIGLRNSVLKGIPRAVWSPIFDQVLKTVKGNAQTLEQRRAAILLHFTDMGVSTKDILATLGVKGEQDIGMEQIVVLAGIKTAIKDGDTTKELAFSQSQSDMTNKLQNLGKKQQAESKPAPGAKNPSADGLTDDDIPGLQR